jgi:hypothetical protein
VRRGVLCVQWGSGKFIFHLSAQRHDSVVWMRVISIRPTDCTLAQC